MEITIRPFFGKIKDFALEYTKAFTSILSGIISIAVSATFQFHSLWQLDLINVGRVWGDSVGNVAYYQGLINAGIPSYSAVYPFIDGPLFKGTVGQAYDFFLGMNWAGWILGMVGVFFIMLGLILFYRANLLEVKSILSNNGLDKPLFPEPPTP